LEISENYLNERNHFLYNPTTFCFVLGDKRQGTDTPIYKQVCLRVFNKTRLPREGGKEGK
jgi:hypothetical protein